MEAVFYVCISWYWIIFLQYYFPYPVRYSFIFLIDFLFLAFLCIYTTFQDDQYFLFFLLHFPCRKIRSWWCYIPYPILHEFDDDYGCAIESLEDYEINGSLINKKTFLASQHALILILLEYLSSINLSYYL